MYKIPSHNPIEYLESMIAGFEEMMKEYKANHLEVPLTRTRELLELFKTNNKEKIVAYYKANKGIGETLGTSFCQVLRFLKDYLSKQYLIT